MPTSTRQQIDDFKDQSLGCLKRCGQMNTDEQSRGQRTTNAKARRKKYIPELLARDGLRTLTVKSTWSKDKDSSSLVSAF